MLPIALELVEVYYFPFNWKSATHGQWLYLQCPFDVWMYDVCICCEQCSQVPPSLPPVNPVLRYTTVAPPSVWAQTSTGAYGWMGQDLRTHRITYSNTPAAIAFLHSYACGSVSMMQTPPCSLAPITPPPPPPPIHQLVYVWSASCMQILLIN